MERVRLGSEICGLGKLPRRNCDTKVGDISESRPMVSRIHLWIVAGVVTCLAANTLDAQEPEKLTIGSEGAGGAGTEGICRRRRGDNCE